MAWGILVFGISCVFVAHALLPIVRPAFAQLLVLLLLPFAIWVAFLLLYYAEFAHDRFAAPASDSTPR